MGETATMAALGLDIRRHAVQNQRVQLLLHMLAVVVSTCGIEQLQPARALSHSHAHAAGTTCTDLGFSGLQLCSDCKLMSTIVTNNEFVQDCYECCAEEKDEANFAIKYAKAVLEICN